MAVLNTNLLTSSSRRNVQYPLAIIALDPKRIEHTHTAAAAADDDQRKRVRSIN
jgi:hypothetical protein